MQFECIEKHIKKHIFSGISDYFRLFLTDVLTPLSLAECQKGINAVQQCYFKNKKGAFTIDFVQQ